jgi:PAS domain S-box-containing protein
MKSNFYREILAAFNSRKKLDYPQKLLAWSGYLLSTALLLLVILWVRYLPIDIDRHNQFLANLRQSQSLGARINQNVLQARDGLLDNYDPIVNDLAQIRQLQVDLHQMPSFVDAENRKELNRLLQKHIDIWQQKEEFILRFQSQNAVLLNSLTYFPTAIASASTAAKNATNPNLSSQLNILLQDILLFNFSADKSLASQINREIQQISTVSLAQAEARTTKTVLIHAQIILEKRALVNNSVTTLMELPTAQIGENLASAYNYRYQQAINRRNDYRFWFYLCSILLVAGIASWIAIKIRVYATATQQAETKYRSIFENSVTGIFQETPNGCFLNANPRLAEIYGYKSVAALIENVRDVEQQIYVLPERRQELVRLMEEKGTVANFESEIYRPDGTRIWISENTRYVRDGKLFYYEGTVTDINARKQTEAALQASEAKFLAAFRSAPHPIVISTIPDCYLLEVNDSFCREMGYTREEVIGRSGLELNFYKNPEDRDRIIETVLEKGAIRHQEVEIYTKRKKVRTIMVSAEIVNFNGQDCCLVMANDITDRKQIEIALREAKIAAESANSTKSKFLANMSHELRTPLNIILGFTQLLLRDSHPMATHQQEHLDTITRSGEHLLELINDILEMSKIEAGRSSLHKTSFDLAQQLQTLSDMWQPKAMAKGLELTLERQAEVPQYIKTDECKLRQVLINLLSNAIKFTETGQISLRVWIEPNNGEILAFPESQRLCFEVKDTGSGIAPEELAILFDAFAQTESGHQSQQGTGLGLAISREFVRLMGGDLTLTTQVKQGTTFRFDIPLAIAQPFHSNTLEGNPPPQQRVIGLAPNQPSYRLLIVEDRDENRQLLVKLLEPLGFELRQAANGREAIDQWESFAPHLIWMDLRMPVMDGYEATRQIKSRQQATTILALTASAFEEERAAAIAAGCDDFIRKPFREEEIFEKMAHHLGISYRYETLVSPGTKNRIKTDLKTTSLLLEQMPMEWRSQLHQSATQVDAEQIICLIERIPPEKSKLAAAITDLMHRYRFDRIVELTKDPHLQDPIPSSAPPIGSK